MSDFDDTESRQRDADLDSVKFDNDIDADRIRTRKQLGFDDEGKRSLDDVIREAKEEYERRIQLQKPELDKTPEKYIDINDEKPM